VDLRIHGPAEEVAVRGRRLKVEMIEIRVRPHADRQTTIGEGDPD
jgi:hypothetical protein